MLALWIRRAGNHRTYHYYYNLMIQAGLVVYRFFYLFYLTYLKFIRQVVCIVLTEIGRSDYEDAKGHTLK